MNKTVLVIGIIFLLIGFSVESSSGNIFEDRSAYYSSLESDDSPIVEIINPKNGSIVYNSSVNISIKCSDDNGVTYFTMIYGTYNHSGGSGRRLKEPKKSYIFNRTIWMYPGYSVILATAYDEKGNVGHDFSIFFYYSNNSIPTGIPPKVEILTPENGTLVYDKNVSMNIKCTDDDGIVRGSISYCHRTGSGGGGIYSGDPILEYYFNETLSRVLPGYNWIMAWAYDVNGSLGYDITLYRYDVMKTCFIIGVMADKKVMDNYTTFKARALLYIDIKTFTFNFYRSGEEIIISNLYSGHVGLFFILGRFNASGIVPCNPVSNQLFFNRISRET